MQIITARNHAWAVDPQRYWHVTQRRALGLLHNASVGEGIVSSISLVRRELEHAMTMYGAFNKHQDKEARWEEVRVEKFSSLPTRQHALFLFDDEALAQEACRSWFGHGDRVVVEAQLVAGSKTHRADVKWLNEAQEKWTESAESYWRGEMTTKPVPEIIVEGAAYFPGWREKPFGLFLGFKGD